MKSRKSVLLMMVFLISVFLLIKGQSGDDDDEFQKFLEQQQQAAQQYMEDDAAAFEKYKEEVIKKWNEFVNSTRKEWVDYSKDLDAKSYINFDEGYVIVEAIAELDKEDAELIAKKKLIKKVKQLFSKNNPAKENVVSHQIVEPETKKIVTSKNVKKFIKKDVLPKVEVVKKFKSEDGKKRIKVKVKIKMVPNHLRIRAKKHLSDVKKWSNKYNLDVPLVMALIQTESYFNPFAKSPIPAYGLMQIVPTSAGKDTYNYLYGRTKVMKPSELYDPHNNIKHGTTYIYLLYRFFKKRIQDPEKKEYAVIASYNTGMGRVNKIIKKVDYHNMSDKEFYEYLISSLPYKETKDYVVRIEQRKENYMEWK